MDSVQSCGCLSALEAGELTKPPGKPAHASIQPGFGCSRSLVEAIRADLQARVDVRGNLGQIKQLENMTHRFDDFAAELALMLDKLEADASYPPTQQTMQQLYGEQASFAVPESTHVLPSQVFDTATYNVRNEFLNCCCLLLSCGIAGCTSHSLTLESEQAVEKVANNCMSSVDRKPYAQLRAVDEEICCCCFHGVNGWLPGWCGDTPKVQEIAAELQARKVGRGNIAQIRNQENTMVKAVEADAWLPVDSLSCLMSKGQREDRSMGMTHDFLLISVPTEDIRSDILLRQQGMQYPPSQATMAAIYGAQQPQLPPASAGVGQAIHLHASEQMPTRSFDITNACERLFLCCQSSHLELNDEEAIFRRKSCCLKSVRREPYAQLGSVEPAQLCCGLCVNVQTDQNLVCPGFGCSHDSVTEIASELQNRKVKRGNIAQIRQQDWQS